MFPRPTMILREATVNDIPSLVAIEKRSSKPHLQANEGTIRERILRYPQGHMLSNWTQLFEVYSILNAFEMWGK